MNTRDPLTLDEVASALSAIPADDREVWVEMAMAVKSEFGADGFAVWDEWSTTAGNYKQSSARDVWKSVQAGGRVTIGSLIARAQAGGHVFNRQPLSGEEKQKRQAEQQRRREQLAAQIEADEALRAAWHERNALVCRAMVGQYLSEVGGSPYLDKKGVRGYWLHYPQRGLVVLTHIEQQRIELITGRDRIGAFFDARKAGDIDPETTSFRYLKKGTACVPMRDIEGRLVSLQFIGADGGKFFLKHSRKSGLFHLVAAEQHLAAPGRLVDGVEVIAVAEGYATAATIHQATGWPVAVCFDAGNLLGVSKALRAAHPGAGMILCADDDRDTAGNPGRAKAEKAAAAVGGVWVLPQFPEVAA